MAAKGYASATDICTILGWDSTDSSLLAQVAFMSELAEDAVDEYCNTTFQWEPATTKVYNGNGTSCLFLGRFLRTISPQVQLFNLDGSLWVDYLYVSAQPQPCAENQGYRWIELPQVPFPTFQGDYFDVPQSNLPGAGIDTPTAALFYQGNGNIQVTGDWGFQDFEFPMRVKQAVAYVVKYLFDMRDYNTLIDFQSGLGRSVKFVDGAGKDAITPFVKATLAHYKNTDAYSLVTTYA